MKKSLPILIVVLLGLLFVGGAFWFIRGINQPPPKEEEEEEEVLLELSEEERPIIALTHLRSCEYELKVENVKPGVASLEYEVTYMTEGGVLQGVPGAIKNPESTVTRELLFGTESSGHRRCDKGVTGGNITIRYRNEQGQLIAKVEQEFNLDQ